MDHSEFIESMKFAAIKNDKLKMIKLQTDHPDWFAAEVARIKALPKGAKPGPQLVQGRPTSKSDLKREQYMEGVQRKRMDGLNF